MNSITITDEMYCELHKLAKFFVRNESKAITLSGTDLFHEACARLIPHVEASATGNCELRPLFALTMRRILVEHARKKLRRETILSRVEFREDDEDDTDTLSSLQDNDSDQRDLAKLIDLDEALRRLAEKLPIHANLVELRYFGGLTVVECAEILKVSNATVIRYWNTARAWLSREMDRLS